LGLVTVVPCDYKGVVHLTVKAKADGSSRYFDETTGQDTPFPAGEEMHAVVPTVDSNIGITPLTEAAWQYLQAKYGVDGWKNAARVTEANTVVGAAFNKYLPKDLQVEKITRLPVLVNGKTTSGSLDATNKNGIYGIVSAGTARAAGLIRGTNDLAPALKLVRQLGKDLCDGEIDLACNGTPVVADTKDVAYLPAQFGETLNRGVGDVANSCGTAGAKEVAFSVTQIGIGSRPFGVSTGGTIKAETYHDQQPIYLLTADGRAFYWQKRDVAVQPLLSGTSFKRLFPQTNHLFAGLRADDRFVSKDDFTDPNFSTLNDEFLGATTTSGYLGNDNDTPQIVRMPSGRAKYYPHFEASDVQFANPLLKEANLGNITSVAAGLNLSYQTVYTGATFYAVTSDGAVYSWGAGRSGALGDGTSSGSPETATIAPGSGEPRKLDIPTSITSVTATQNGAFGLGRDGSVWEWGFASAASLYDFADLGNPDTTRPHPIKEPFAQYGPIQQISCGISRTCAALTRAGKLLVWGRFGDAYAPQPVTEKRYPVTEVQLPAGRRVTYLGASQDMVYAVLDDGKLVVFSEYPENPQFLDIRPLLPAGSGPVSGSTCKAPT
jgi:hypothetical protein